MTEEEVEENIKHVQRPVSFHKIYATNVSGEWTEYDFRIELFNEKMKVEDVNEKMRAEDEEWTYISEGMIILTPHVVKKLKSILDEAVKEYEEKKES